MHSQTLRIIGQAEIPEPLEIGHDYAFAGRISIVEIAKQDNFDGNLTYQHKGKLSLIEVVNKAGKTFKGVAKGSKSQKMRYKIMERGDNEYYEMVMQVLLNNLDEILDKYII